MAKSADKVAKRAKKNAEKVAKKTAKKAERAAKRTTKKTEKTAKKAKKDKSKKAGEKKEVSQEFTYKTPEGDQAVPVPETPSSDRAIIIDKSGS